MRFAIICASLCAALGVAGKAFGLGEESFGNSRILAENYKDWPGLAAMLDDEHRVYSYWVNGNEGFFFDGDLKALNTSLERFGEVEAKGKRLVLLAGETSQKSFHGKQVPYAWRLQIMSGIAKSFAIRHNKPQIYHFEPTIYVYVNDAFPLQNLKIPKGIVVEDIRDLRRRYYAGIDKGDRQVAGYAAFYLSEVDSFNKQSAAKIATILKKDDDGWAVSMVCASLKRFGAAAQSELDNLQKTKTTKESTTKAITEAVEAIQNGKPDKAAEDALAKVAQQIEDYLDEMRRK